MPEMGKYCKAYQAKDLRAFSGWREDVSALAPNSEGGEGGESQTPRQRLGDEDILYMQENYVVTDGIFKGEHVIFSDVTPEWKTFCHEKLGFQIPEWASEGNPA